MASFDDHSVMICRLRGMHGLSRLALSEVELDFFEQGGEELLFLQAGVHVFAAIDRAITGDDNHGHAWILLVYLLRQFQTIHAFHAKIRDQDVKLFFAEFIQRIGGAVCRDRPVALHFQNFATQSCQHLVVIDEQDSFHEVTFIVIEASR